MEVTNDLIRYFDMFAGIGGFRAGLTRAGGFQCVGHCEIDKYADASYRAIHDIGEEEVYYPDAREIDPGGMPDFDLLCGGFPCQSWSAAGNRLGFADPRGTLFFEIARLAEARKPAYLLLENVPAFYSMTRDRRLRPSSPRFMSWGMVSNGMCATAQTTGLLNRGKGCSLSDILIPDAPARYFLSPEMTARLLYSSSEERRDTGSTISQESPAPKPQAQAAPEPKPDCT